MYISLLFKRYKPSANISRWWKHPSATGVSSVTGSRWSKPRWPSSVRQIAFLSVLRVSMQPCVRTMLSYWKIQLLDQSICRLLDHSVFSSLCQLTFFPCFLSYYFLYPSWGVIHFLHPQENQGSWPSGVPSTSAARSDDLKWRPFRKNLFPLAEKNVNQHPKISDDFFKSFTRKMNILRYKLCRPPLGQCRLKFSALLSVFTENFTFFHVNLTFFT